MAQALQMTRANEEIYKTFSQCLRVAGSRHGGAFRHLAIQPALQLEAAPFINRIISPHLRPVRYTSICWLLPPVAYF